MNYYTINPELLELECLKDLQRGNRTAAFVVLSFICHWTLLAKQPTAQLRLGILAETWNIKQSTFSKAVKMLEECGLIKCVKPWQRVGSKPGEYIIVDKSSYIPGVTKLYTRSHLAIASRTTVNNYNNNYKKNDSSNKESSSKGDTSSYRPNTEGKNSWE